MHLLNPFPFTCSQHQKQHFAQRRTGRAALILFQLLDQRAVSNWQWCCGHPKGALQHKKDQRLRGSVHDARTTTTQCDSKRPETERALLLFTWSKPTVKKTYIFPQDRHSTHMHRRVKCSVSKCIHLHDFCRCILSIRSALDLSFYHVILVCVAHLEPPNTTIPFQNSQLNGTFVLRHGEPKHSTGSSFDHSTRLKNWLGQKLSQWAKSWRRFTGQGFCGAVRSRTPTTFPEELTFLMQLCDQLCDFLPKQCWKSKSNSKH